MAAIMLASMLASCQGSASQSDTSVTSADTSTEAVETRNPLLDDLGEFDFDGYEYNVLSATYDPSSTFTLFDVEEVNGVVLHDSLYKRNREIEDRFNIKFKASEMDYGGCFSTIQKEVTAGECAYDLIMLINRNAYTAAINNWIMPVSELTYLDLSKPYYIKDINEALTIDGKMFLAYSEESVYTFERTCMMAYNKKLAEDYKLPNLYEEVRSGKWTLDKMFEYAELVSDDLDGNGTMTKDDRWGIIGDPDYIFPSIYISAGESSVKRNAEGELYFSALTSQRFSDIIDMTLENLNKGTIFWHTRSMADYNQKFMSDGSMFLSTCIGRLFGLREMEGDFGVIPCPKYDEEQENYIGRACDAWLHVVPITNPDPERTSVIMEALASGTARYVFPAYYDKYIQQKVLRDDDSIEMIEIIRANRVVDLGECPWFETIRLQIENQVILEQTSPLSSLLTSIEPQVKKLITEAKEYAKTLR